MFNTIKSKILLITLLMLSALMIVVSSYAYIYLRNSKSLLLKSWSHSIAVFAQNINKEVIRIDNNTDDLALIGSIFYKTRNEQIAKYSVTNIFNNYKDSLGGGIWFEPYKIDSLSKRYCLYAFRNKQNQIVLDESFNSDEYNYLNQNWYKQIAAQIKDEDDTAWSTPYYEDQGSETLMITAGAGIFDNDGKMVGISTVDWEINSIVDSILSIKPTPNSFALFADVNNDYVLVSTDPYLDNVNLTGKSLENIPWYNDNLKKITYFNYHNKKYIPYVKTLDNDMILIVVIPKNELFQATVLHVIFLFVILVLVSLIISALLYLLLRNNIVRPIDKLTNLANKISRGDSEIHIKIDKPEEFARLASTFDKMTENIKSITKEREQINSELSIAKSIQTSSLPNVFPPFPDCKEFDIYALMEPAKEVGGDFYDFYFIDDDKFMFLIADVSGKGVPAALFMMTVKTLINNLSQVGYSPKELIETVNKKICAGNNHGFFVTMFAAIVNIKTGEITYINCGHNQPLIKTLNGDFKYLDIDSNIVLGAFDDFEFNVAESKLNSGDTILIYTDGITEALNMDGEMFGEKRLLECSNSFKNNDVKSMAENIKNAVNKYAFPVPQSDDITMLIFKYNAAKKIFKDFALKENYKSFYTWLHNICSEWNLDDSLTNKIDMCGEELFANITFYAYPERTGTIEVTAKQTDNVVTLCFEDEGIQYNPLEKPDPDITLALENRKPGGLGIFMVKEMADEVKYEYLDGKNILTVEFYKI